MGLIPSDIRNIGDLAKLPILSKMEVRAEKEKFLSTAFNIKKLVKVSTSGTTGAGMTFYRQPETLAFQWAVWWRFRKRFGLNLYDRHANFGGKQIVPRKQNNPPFWRENRPLNQTYFSTYHLSKDTVQSYADQLNRGCYVYYSGYPSTMSILAQLIEEVGLKIENPPKVINTGSEKLLTFQKTVMERVFQAPVIDQYGAAEHICNMSQCPQGNYHQDMELGIIEYESSKKTSNVNYGSIIATGLVDMAMPLIRYRISDAATFGEGACRCGRAAPFATEIDGRNEDYILTRDGKKVGRMAHVFADLKHVYESQIIQTDLNQLIVYVVHDQNYTKADEEFFAKKIHNLVGDEMMVNFEYLKRIPREANGKFRAVKSELKMERTQ